MYIVQLQDYGFVDGDIVAGLLIQGDIGLVYDVVAFNNFINGENDKCE